MVFQVILATTTNMALRSAWVWGGSKWVARSVKSLIHTRPKPPQTAKLVTYQNGSSYTLFVEIRRIKQGKPITNQKVSGRSR